MFLQSMRNESPWLAKTPLRHVKMPMACVLGDTRDAGVVDFIRNAQSILYTVNKPR